MSSQSEENALKCGPNTILESQTPGCSSSQGGVGEGRDTAVGGTCRCATWSKALRCVGHQAQLRAWGRIAYRTALPEGKPVCDGAAGAGWLCNHADPGLTVSLRVQLEADTTSAPGTERVQHKELLTWCRKGKKGNRQHSQGNKRRKRDKEVRVK